MSLVVATEPRENRQLLLSIQAPQARIDKELQKAARKISSQHGVPGFRKGKAPYNMVVRAYGLANLYGEFVDELGQELFKDAIEQEKIKPYAMAQLEKVEMEPTLTYKVVVPLEPKIELGDYRSLRVEEPKPEIDEEKVNQRLEQYREQFADWRAVTEAAKYGDMLTIDVQSAILNEDGSEGAAVLNETDWEVTLDEENPLEPAGLDKQLLGMTPGESKTFELTYDSESRSINAGKTARFHVTLQKAQSYDKPPLDDSLAQLVGPDFNTLEELKTSIRNSLAEAEKNRLEDQYINMVLDAVIESSTLDYPPVVVEDQLDGMMEDFAARLRQFGVEDINWYFQQTGQSIEKYREGMRESATLLARRHLVLSEILEAEKLSVSDEELEERISAMTANASEEQKEQTERFAQSLRTGAARSILVSQLLREKGIKQITAIARGEDVPLPSNEPATTPENTSESEQETTVLDDLTRIEGIGPKISSVLHSAGIKTFEILANTSQDDLNAVLQASNLGTHDPATWAQQAALAAAGKWDELDTLQARLTGGRE